MPLRNTNRANLVLGRQLGSVEGGKEAGRAGGNASSMAVRLAGLARHSGTGEKQQKTTEKRIKNFRQEVCLEKSGDKDVKFCPSVSTNSE